MAQDDLYFRLRIPADLKDRIKAASLGNHRSVTAEIIALLEKAYPDLSQVDTQTAGGALVAEIAADVDHLKAKVERLRAMGSESER